MTRTFPAFRKHWLALAATVVLLAAALIAGTLFAANDRQDPDLFPLREQLPSDGTDPGLADEAPALMVEAELPEHEAGTSVSQVTSESDGSDALSEWLANRPDVMGPFTVQDAMSADSQTVDWLLYQAVYKEVMTQDEADAFQDWYNQRPSTQEAPELLNHLPAYLDRPHQPDNSVGMFRDTEAR